MKHDCGTEMIEVGKVNAIVAIFTDLVDFTHYCPKCKMGIRLTEDTKE